MDRRRFLKNSLKTCGAMALPVTSPSHVLSKEGNAQIRTDKVRPRYIREEIPPFEIPPYKGKIYEDKVPDTIDLAERLRLAVNGVTSLADPEADYEIYWLSDYTRNPAIMLHDFNDWVQNQEGIMEVLPLLRSATGDARGSDIDPAWMKSILKSIGPDGLLYLSLEGRPWSRLNADGVNPVWKADGTRTTFNDRSVTQVTSAAVSHRTISTMTIYYLRDGNPMWRAAIEKMIQGLAALTVDRGDFCYFPGGTFEPGTKPDPSAPVPRGSMWGTTWNVRLVQSLAQYYRVSGYEPARQLAAKLSNYARFHGEIFDPEGPWLLDHEMQGKAWSLRGEDFNVEGRKLGGHGHGHGIALLSVLEHALAVGDRDLVTFARNSYEWMKRPKPSFGVSHLVGWFPEWWVPNFPVTEGCLMGDVLAIAVKLTAAGAGDCWDELDRWLRNNFAEMQLTSTDWVYRLAARSPTKPVEANETSDHVAEKNVGLWAGWSTPNDWLGATGIQHCCSGNAPRGLYYVWQHMLDHRDDQLRVHLLMNRAAKWADVLSYIPYEGRVDCRIKEPLRGLRLRAPEWIATGNLEIRCKVNGASRPLGWEGRYVEVGAVKPGDTATLTFPIYERTVREKIGRDTYSLVLKGNTVVSIAPPGKNGPLYLGREKYRTGPTQWAKLTRFVPEKTIFW